MEAWTTKYRIQALFRSGQVVASICVGGRGCISVRGGACSRSNNSALLYFKSYFPYYSFKQDGLAGCFNSSCLPCVVLTQTLFRLFPLRHSYPCVSQTAFPELSGCPLHKFNATPPFYLVQSLKRPPLLFHSARPLEQSRQSLAFRLSFRTTSPPAHLLSLPLFHGKQSCSISTPLPEASRITTHTSCRHLSPIYHLARNPTQDVLGPFLHPEPHGPSPRLLSRDQHLRQIIPSQRFHNITIPQFLLLHSSELSRFDLSLREQTGPPKSQKIVCLTPH